MLHIKLTNKQNHMIIANLIGHCGPFVVKKHFIVSVLLTALKIYSLLLLRKSTHQIYYLT